MVCDVSCENVHGSCDVDADDDDGDDVTFSIECYVRLNDVVTLIAFRCGLICCVCGGNKLKNF